MTKKEIKLYAAQLLETGKGLALASLMPAGKAKEEAERILNLNADSVCSQLELLADDCTYKEIEENLGEA